MKYREKKLFRVYEDKVVTDVEFLGVYKYFVCYRFPTKYLGNDIKTIKCEDVYEIVDDNNEKIDYSCSDFTYDPTIGVIDNTQADQSNLKIGGGYIALAGMMGIISKIDKEMDRQDTYGFIIWGSLFVGGLTLLRDNNTTENINEKKTE